MTFNLVLSAVTYLSILFVALPMVKSDFWIFRSLEYSRFQNFILCVILAILWLISWQVVGEINVIPFALNGLCLVYLAVKISPYTVLAKKEVKKSGKRDEKKELKVINANVLQTNTAYEVLLAQIKRNNPDLVLLLETDVKWQEAMQDLKSELPYTIEAPQSNTYGMLLYSKFRLEDGRIDYLVKDDVPSISCKVILPTGDKIQLWGLHPEPPVPGESLTSTPKDKELSIIALKAKDCKIPIIVMGDLNDVAWSHTTSLFTKTSGLLDVRKGRGFYSTFSAHHWFIRFPLDYIFCSSDFSFISMKRLKKNGSDHFPIFTHLMLSPEMKKVQEKPAPSEAAKEESEEKAEKEVRSDD